MKKSLKTILALSNLVIATSLITVVLSGQLALIETRGNSSFEIKKVPPLTPADFITPDVRNNEIIDGHAYNYQYRELVGQTVVNDPAFYDGNSVLSMNSIQTVRSENFYFNFVKPTGSLVYNIISTPVDPSSYVVPKILETNLTEMIGSALWISNKLVVIGQTSPTELGLLLYSVDADGNLTQKNLNFEQSDLLTPLLSTTTKEITIVATTQKKTVPTNPIYLSPFTDYSTPNDNKYHPENGGFQVLVWRGLEIFGSLTPDLAPVIIKYSIYGNVEFSKLTLPLELLKPLIKTSTINAMTPIITNDRDGNLTTSIYAHSIGSVSSMFVLYITKFNLDQKNLNPVEYDGIVLNQPADQPNLSLGVLDTMAIIPYALVAKGDAKDPTPNSKIINLFWFVSPNSLTNLPGMFSNVVIDNDDVNPGNTMWFPPNRNLQTFILNSFLFGNFLYADQMAYSNNNNLEDGIYISMRFRGVMAGVGQPRVGHIKWQKPWDPNFWSELVLASQVEIIKQYNVLNPTATGYVPTVMSTIWDDKFTAVGLYHLSPSPTVAPHVKTITSNLSTGYNDYNTIIPENIFVNDFLDLDPDNLLALDSIIKQKVIDLSHFFEFKPNFVEANKPEDGDLTVMGNAFSLYINGAVDRNSEIPISIQIQRIPDQNQITTPIKVNKSSLKASLPSGTSLILNEAFSINEFLENPGVIGTTSGDFFQVETPMITFTQDFKAESDDFLGSLNISYNINANGKIMEHSLTINGFWGLVYLIPIIGGIVILIFITIILIFFFLKRKNKSNLLVAVNDSFKLANKHSSLIKPSLINHPSNAGPPRRMPPNKFGTKIPPPPKRPAPPNRVTPSN